MLPTCLGLFSAESLPWALALLVMPESTSVADSEVVTSFKGSGLLICCMTASTATLAAICSADVSLPASPVPLMGTLTLVSLIGSMKCLTGYFKGEEGITRE